MLERYSSVGLLSAFLVAGFVEAYGEMDTLLVNPLGVQLGKFMFWVQISRRLLVELQMHLGCFPTFPTSSYDSHSFPQREAKGSHSFSLGLWKTGISTIYTR
jgi:hypothetical protein